VYKFKYLKTPFEQTNVHITFIYYQTTATERNTKISAFNAFGAGVQQDSKLSGCNSSNPREIKKKKGGGDFVDLIISNIYAIYPSAEIIH
jgi:hypothetical protein